MLLEESDDAGDDGAALGLGQIGELDLEGGAVLEVGEGALIAQDGDELARVILGKLGVAAAGVAAMGMSAAWVKPRATSEEGTSERPVARVMNCPRMFGMS